MPLRLSREADEDSRLIYLFGAAKFGVAIADRYAANIDRALALIADHPHVARLRDEVDDRTHAYPVGSHLIIYEIENATDVIVLRIRHSREDWQHED